MKNDHLAIKKTEFMAVDYETTGLNVYKGDTPFSASISNQEGEYQILRFDCKKNGIANKNTFIDILKDDTIKKVAHNAKFEISVTKSWLGYIPKSEWYDTIIMSQIIQNLRLTHKLEALCNKFFSENFPKNVRRWKYYDEEVKKHISKQKRILNNYPERWQDEIIKPMLNDNIEPLNKTSFNYGLIPKNIMDGYQAADAERGIWLHEYLWDDILNDKNRLKAFNMEMKMIFVAQRMEEIGVMLHEENAEELISQLSKDVDKLKKEKRKVFGYDINLDSPKQLREVLFGGKFNFQPVLYTDTGAPSASKEALKQLKEKYPENQVFDLIQRWRAYSRGLSMVRKYKQLAGENKIIHPNINTNKAKTGRESVAEPSLQNVAKEFSIHSAYGIPARKCFRPRPGYVYFLGDYAGIELRLFISESNEKTLIDEFKKNSLFDAHSFNSEIIYGDEFIKGDTKTRKTLRARIKDAVFGLAYGSKLPTWANSIGKNLKEAKYCLDRYAERCPNICNFNRDVSIEVRSNGYIRTGFGRRLNIFRDEAYKGANYKIQGTAAEILKIGKINISEYINSNFGDDVLRLLLSVHDENMIEMHRSLLPQKKEILHDLAFCMVDMPEISVPLEVEWNIARTCWGQKAELDIDK